MHRIQNISDGIKIPFLSIKGKSSSIIYTYLYVQLDVEESLSSNLKR